MSVFCMKYATHIRDLLLLSQSSFYCLGSTTPYLSSLLFLLQTSAKSRKIVHVLYTKYGPCLRHGNAAVTQLLRASTVRRNTNSWTLQEWNRNTRRSLICGSGPAWAIKPSWRHWETKYELAFLRRWHPRNKDIEQHKHQLLFIILAQTSSVSRLWLYFFIAFKRIKCIYLIQ